MQPPKFQIFTNLKRQISKTGQALWLYYAIQICVSLGAGLIAGLILSFVPFHLIFGLSQILQSMILLAGSLLSGILAFLFFNDQYKVAIGKSLKQPFHFGDVWNGYSVMVLVSVIFGILFMIWNWLSPFSIEQPDFGYSSNSMINLFLFITVVLVGPFVEELFFRGTILTSFKKYGENFAIVFSSLCFALMHMNLAQGIPTFFMGCILGYMYTKSGSLWLSILIHALNNGVSFIAMNPIGEGIASLLILFGLLYGIFYLIVQRSTIENNLKQWQSARSNYTILFKNGWMIAFFLLFIVNALWTLLWG